MALVIFMVLGHKQKHIRYDSHCTGKYLPSSLKSIECTLTKTGNQNCQELRTDMVDIIIASA